MRTQLWLPLLAALCAHAQLVKDWHAVETPHFELVSRYDPAKVGPLLEDLEWARAVFETNFGLKSHLDRQALILVPDSPFDYEQLSPSKQAGGYYLAAPWRDIVVLRELIGARHALLHEYTHLVLRHQGGRWPLWFNEGTAEYYATMRKNKDGSVEAGIADEKRFAVLHKGAWIPIAYLVEADATTALSTADSIARSYAQAWLLVDMLHHAPGYRRQFPRFQGLLAEGVRTEEALDRVYSRKLLDFDNDAREWFRQSQFPMEKLMAPTEATAKARSRAIGEVEVEIARRTVAVSGPARGEARAEYGRLTRAAGSRCELQAAVGDLAYAARMMREASSHYQAALKCGAKVADLAEGYESAIRAGERVSVGDLAPAVERGSQGHWHFMLGTAHFFEGSHEAALREFDLAIGLTQTEEFRMRRLRAMSLAHLGRYQEAEEAAEKMKSVASDADQRQTARSMADEVRREREQAAKTDVPYHKLILRRLTKLEGVVVRVDCMGQRARFWVQSGGVTRKLLIADPSEVITGESSNPGLEFACGVQQRKVMLGYQERSDAETDTVGRIRYMEFPK
jgi:tetratricopeptide (TPR) repeat protein